MSKEWIKETEQMFRDLTENKKRIQQEKQNRKENLIVGSIALPVFILGIYLLMFVFV